jgi:hypothetical protein
MFCALSPAVGHGFRIADQKQEDIAQLALEGKYHLHSTLFGLKAAIDTLLDDLLEKAENLASIGENMAATELLKSCISLTGAKDDHTLKLVNFLINQTNQKSFQSKPRIDLN